MSSKRLTWVWLAAVLAACSGPSTSDGGTGGGGGGSGGTGGGGGTQLYRSILPDGVEGLGYSVAKQGSNLVAVGAATRLDGGTRGIDLFVARFDTSRTLDTSFGEQGMAFADADGGMMTFIGTANGDSASDVLVDGDGVVVAGYGRSLVVPGAGSVVLARFSSTGQRVPTFGNASGLRIDTFFSGANPVEGAYTVLRRQADGKLLAGGTVQGNFFVARFNADGSPDLGFAKTPGSGFGNAWGGAGTEWVRGMVVQSSGKVVVAGGDQLVTSRLNADGTNDLTFGSAGFARAAGAPAEALLQRPGGALLVLGIGSRTTGSTRQALVSTLQLTADGLADPLYGALGRVDAELPVAGAAIRGAALLPSGQVLLYVAGTGPTWLVRLTSAGLLDTTFGTGGVRELSIRLPLLQATDVGANHLLVDGSTAWICDINNQKFAEPDQRKNFFDVVRVDL